ncbi:MAG: pyridoxamine 5'-phosphate oxidase family protein [Anaeromyxobacteraceae bacterium]
MAARSDRAEAVRKLLREAHHGLLSTSSLEPAGYPYGSLVQLATTPEVEPVFLISHLAQHTKNLVADPRASVLVQEATDGDPQQSARAAIIGDARRLEGEAAEAVRERFLARHPDASMYFGLGFQLWALRPVEARYIGGFGAALWIGGEELLGG